MSTRIALTDAANDGLSLLRNVLHAADAGHALPPDDTRRLGRAIHAALAGDQLEAALGLGPRWRTILARVLEEIALGELPRQSDSARVQAAKLSSALARYRLSAVFEADLRNGGAPPGPRRVLFDLLRATGGRVPAPETLRKTLRRIGAPSPLQLPQHR